MTSLDRFRTLGRSGLRVSPLTLGTMTFGEDKGWGSDPETSHRILSAYLDAGGNSIDTANAYTIGHSEKIIGDYFAARPGLRDRVVIGTKFFSNMHPGDPNGGGAGRKSILDQLEQSLRRLQTDYVDLLWLHNWDRTTPIEETMRTLDDLVRDGKVRYIAFSDVPVWVAGEAQTIARLRAWSPLIAFQLEYSLLERTVEGAYLPMCAEHGIGVMPWGPLKGGLLTGKFRRDRTESDDARRLSSVAGTTDAQWAVIEELAAVAEEIGATPAAVAINWVSGGSGISSTLIGSRTLEQFEANLDSLGFELDDSYRQRLEQVSTPTPDFPAMYLDAAGALQYPETTVDGRTYAASPALVDGVEPY